MAEILPQSTVSETAASTPLPPAELQSKLNKAIDRVGYAPRSESELNQFYRMSFSPEELKQYGLDTQYQDLQSKTQQAGANLDATPPPTTSGLNVLQRALNAKNTVTNQPLGESDLFQKAGISGYSTLRQSLAQRNSEMTNRYNSFANKVGDVAQGMTDTYNLALTKYQRLRSDLDTEDQKMQSMLDEALEYERGLDLMQRQTSVGKEAQEWGYKLEAKYAPSDPSSNLSGTRLTTGGASNGAGHSDPVAYVQGFNFGDGKRGSQITDGFGNVVGKITSPFGADHSALSGESSHNAVDMVFNGGEVQAMAPGVVSKTGYSQGVYGGYVWIEDYQGNTLQYGHMDPDNLPAVGSTVIEGTPIGGHSTDSKTWGASSGPHTDIRYVGTNSAGGGADPFAAEVGAPGEIAATPTGEPKSIDSYFDDAGAWGDGQAGFGQ